MRIETVEKITMVKRDNFSLCKVGDKFELYRLYGDEEKLVGGADFVSANGHSAYFIWGFHADRNDDENPEVVALIEKTVDYPFDAMRYLWEYREKFPLPEEVAL